MSLTILLTGFGPFPTAPFNPTAALVGRLARLRRPAFADVRLVAHVFATRYQAIDLELPQLIAQHRPDAILMFGLAARRRWLSIETRARNSVSLLLPDGTGGLAAHNGIVRGGPASRKFPPCCRKLTRPIDAARVPVRLSRDAGRYVCNYLCWRALEGADGPDGPLTVFVHVPQVARSPAPQDRVSRGIVTMPDLARAGSAVLAAITVEARRRRHSSVGKAAYPEHSCRLLRSRSAHPSTFRTAD